MMRAWYIPAWNGDWRLEPDPSAPDERTILTIKRPTADEKRLLRLLCDEFAKKTGWVDLKAKDEMRNPPRWMEGRAVIGAPLSEIGPIVSSLVKPGPNVLTAVRFKDGLIEVCETSAPASKDLVKSEPYRTPSDPAPKVDKIDKPSEESKALAKKEDAEAAATVKRPTPCCPDCYISDDVNKPATEVLLAFMNQEEHESWARNRYMVVRGGITGHRYLIAHRNSPAAQKNTRMAFDLDDNATMHFHDWLVPPEEEALAAMLILKFREPWLRNEATALGNHTYVFKNPFGGGGDGVRDSGWTAQVGLALLEILGATKQMRPGRRLGEIGYTDGALDSEISPVTYTLL